MKLAPALLLAVLAIAAAPLGGAQDAGAPRQITLEARDDGASGPFYFTLEGRTEHNPTLVLKPGEVVAVRVVNQGRAEHNARFMPMDQATPMLKPGEDATLALVAPDTEGTHDYWCDPHKPLRMAGKLLVSSNPDASSEDPEDEGKQTPVGPVVAIIALALGAPLLAFERWRRRVG